MSPYQTHPVEIHHLKHATPDYLQAALTVVQNVHKFKGKADILVFLPGENEIETLCSQLRRAKLDLEVLPLYSLMASKEQKRVFQPSSKRRCIVTTTMAENFTTVDKETRWISNVKYVVDSGLRRLSYQNPRTRMDMLLLTPVSKQQAQQRTKRAGAFGPGECYRLYTKKCYKELAEDALPDKLRLDITDEILYLKNEEGSVDLTEYGAGPENVLRALGDLNDWGYLDDQGDITRLGRDAASQELPVHPVWYRVLLEAAKCDCSVEMVSIAALLSTRRTVFLRPYSHRHVADLARQQFGHPLSDHMSLLNAFYAYCGLLKEVEAGLDVDVEEWCTDHFLSHAALEDALEIEGKIRDFLREHRLIKAISTPFRSPQYDTNIRKALARGFCTQTAFHEADDVYRTVHRGDHALLSRTSALLNKNHQWVVYHRFHLVAHCRQYLEVVTAIKPEWLVDLPYFQDERWARPRNGSGDVIQAAAKASIDEARQRMQQSD